MKEHFMVSLDESIVEKFSDKELILVCGGSALKKLLSILIGGDGDGVCDNDYCTNTNCVPGCACSK